MVGTRGLPSFLCNGVMLPPLHFERHALHVRPSKLSTSAPHGRFRCPRRKAVAAIIVEHPAASL
jgi:hypothetical protein